ncbi:MarR family transcriptional regulator [Brevibacterium sp. p3-SID960]|uniref:MarR family winged helix-turn-helix transcriptional regulator n=1 Tax=Brevibacterium sp. p3-SID960 TaxID=2916063 RepID=UPI0021A5E01F|nr:MarR family transcriptional regulator [Brevibacterium sp. p3-SID960]MCT1690268.1 MarR family transcriptional regulator [Brevibacterium sp. p3-SID960]
MTTASDNARPADDEDSITGEKELIFAGVHTLANRMQAHYDARLRPLSFKQLHAMLILSRLHRLPLISHLARVLGTSHQNTAKLVRALEKLGFAMCRPHPSDRRGQTVELTPAAQEYLARTTDFAQDALDEIFAGIGDRDVATCMAVLDRMSLNLNGQSLRPDPEVLR